MYETTNSLIIFTGLRMIALALCIGGELFTLAADQASQPHLKYFGFALVDVGYDDLSDSETRVNYVDEVKDFTNCADILPVSPNDNISERIESLNEHGLKAIVHLSSLFFESTGPGGPSGYKHALRADYLARWKHFVALNNLSKLTNKILCFYLGEEPSWNSIPPSQLKAASDLIKRTIPATPILIIEAYLALATLQVPTSVDWIGFDHYFVKDPFNDLAYRSEFETLKSKKSRADQNIVIVMDSHYIAHLHGSANISESDMSAVAESYFRLAQSSPEVIAMLGYVWPGGFGGPDVKGARNLGLSVRQKYAEIGKFITGK